MTVLLSPVVQPWYFLWCVPLLAACALGPGSRAVLTWVTLALGVSAPLGSSLQGRPVATVVTTAATGAPTAFWPDTSSSSPETVLLADTGALAAVMQSKQDDVATQEAKDAAGWR